MHDQDIGKIMEMLQWTTPMGKYIPARYWL